MLYVDYIIDREMQAAKEYSSRNFTEAERQCKEMLLKNPNDSEALSIMGAIAVEVGRLDIAASLFSKSISLNEGKPHLYSNLGNVFVRQEKYKEAEFCFRHAIALDPLFPESYNGLAFLYTLAGRTSDVAALYRQAIAIEPFAAKFRSNLGHAIFAEGDVASAEHEFRGAIDLDQNTTYAKAGLALCLLDRGELAEGWELYETRLETIRTHSHQRTFPMPLWHGEALSGKTILVWREEGVGDEIKFASCLPDLARLGGRVIFEASERLVSLYTRSFPNIEVRKENLADGDYQGIDFHLSVGSLPKFFRREFEQFPAKSNYLKPAPERIEFWRGRLDELGDGRKIGICWRSQNRSIFKNPFNASVADLGDIFKVPGLVWINLQYDECAAELAEIKSHYGVDLHIWPDLDLKNDFENVAALIAALDGVVGARTTVAALAGALSVSNLMYATTPNVLALGREIDPWFPTTRIFTRRRDEGWGRVIGEISAHLTNTAT
jgi:Flp pilus assembly protein TadD